MRYVQVLSGVFLISAACITAQEMAPVVSEAPITRQSALEVANDSNWARTVSPSLQYRDCDYQNPAWPST